MTRGRGVMVRDDRVKKCVAKRGMTGGEGVKRGGDSG